MFEVEIVDRRGRKLDAHVMAGNSQIVLRSRGDARDPSPGSGSGYRKALETIHARFAAQQITPETFLDRGSARRNAAPLEGPRLIGPDEVFDTDKAFAAAVIGRADAEPQSQGSWQRLLMRVPPVPDYALRSIVDGEVERRKGVIPIDQLRRVEKRHVDAAIAELRSGRPRRTRFGNSIDWDLYPDDGGKLLPPKMVFGIALAEALQTHTTPDDFSSGAQIFDLLRGLGFRVLRWSDTPARRRSVRKPQPSLTATDEEQGWLEGNPRVAEHLVRERSGTLPAQFKAAFRIDHGKLFCERCTRDFLDLYEDAAIAEACFEAHHTIPVAQMPTGHVTTFDQLRLLCANCHRATHREMAQAARASASEA